VTLTSLVGKTDEHTPPVDVAHRASDEPVPLEPRDDAGEGALAEIRGVGQLLHTLLHSVLFHQALEHLELAHAQSVSLTELALQGTPGPGMAFEEFPPDGDPSPVRFLFYHV
jgi:hypothetical protein